MKVTDELISVQNCINRLVQIQDERKINDLPVLMFLPGAIKNLEALLKEIQVAVNLEKVDTANKVINGQKESIQKYFNEIEQLEKELGFRS